MKTIAVVGPTASGKTHRAVSLAKQLSGEIISADSRQVYSGMTIGTGKDLEEYENIPYHLIDIAPAGTKFNLYRYLDLFHKAYKDIHDRNKRIVICGGTGLYIESALNGIILPEVPENKELRNAYKEKTLEELTQILRTYKKLHNTTDIDSTQRAIRAIEIAHFYNENPDAERLADKTSAKPIDAVVIGIDIPREERRNRITLRLKKRLEDGMVDEIKNLLDSGISPDDLMYYGLEYKFITQHVIGQLSYEEMFHQLEIAIHQFSKRQMTWFRGMEKRGTKINWLPYNLSDSEFLARTLELLDNPHQETV